MERESHNFRVRARGEIACFMYHDVAADPAASGFQRPSAARYKLVPEEFYRHLDRIAESGLRPELVGESDPALPGRRLMITFDDGGRGAILAAEALARRGWKAHFFVVTDRVGTGTFLDSGAIRELRRAGHLVGTHSHRHPNIFRDLAWPRMLEEWRVSLDILEGILGERPRIGSVPGGDASRLVYASAAAAGLDWLFTSEPVLRPERVGRCWIVGRFGVKAGMRPDRLGRLAKFRGWGRALAARRAKLLARRALGPAYRLYVRQATREVPGRLPPFAAPDR